MQTDLEKQLDSVLNQLSSEHKIEDIQNNREVQLPTITRSGKYAVIEKWRDFCKKFNLEVLKFSEIFAERIGHNFQSLSIVKNNLNILSKTHIFTLKTVLNKLINSLIVCEKCQKIDTKVNFLENNKYEITCYACSHIKKGTLK